MNTERTQEARRRLFEESVHQRGVFAPLLAAVLGIEKHGEKKSLANLPAFLIESPSEREGDSVRVKS